MFMITIAVQSSPNKKYSEAMTADVPTGQYAVGSSGVQPNTP